MGTGTEKRKTGRPKGSKSGYTVSEKALAQRRSVNPSKKAMEPFEGEDIAYNARQIEHILHIQSIAAGVDPKDPVSLKSAFLQYLALCAQDGCKVGNLAAYAAMGVSKDRFLAWGRSKDPAYVDLYNLVKTACALNRESMIADQKINPVIGIFWQRNYDGLRNDTETAQPAEPTDLREGQTADEYRKRYADLLEK